jgi:cytochrome c-type protein NapB
MSGENNDTKPDQGAHGAQSAHGAQDVATSPIFLAGVLGISLAGFFIGTHNDNEGGAWQPKDVKSTTQGGEALDAARSYKDLAAHPWNPQSPAWTSIGSTLQKQQPPGADASASRAQALDARNMRRAYEGAPPVVPHGMVAKAQSDCLACHRDGAVMPAGQVAPRMSHQEYVMCTQCHATDVGAPQNDALLDTPLVGTSWQGLRADGLGGERAWEGAPPLVPHSLQAREDCMSCHGPYGQVALRTSHPERANCEQCHAFPLTNQPSHPMVP